MQRVTAKFGDISFTTQSIHASPTEENELHATIVDPPCEIKNYFQFTPIIPKGTLSITTLVRTSPHCPNCGHEINVLGHYELKEIETYNYDGVVVTVMPSYEEHILELKFHYETVQYESKV